MRIGILEQGFGADVSDFDVHGGCDPTQVAQLRLAYDEHGLLIFRGEKEIAPQRQAEICRWFGPVLRNEATGEDWGYLRNSDTAGSIPLPYHCDMSYLDHPILGISLHAVALPLIPTPTVFISNRLAWSGLPEELRDEVQSLTLRHFFSGYRYDGWPDFDAFHPVRLLHPKTGRELLFVTAQHASRLLEVDAACSDALIARLLKHIYQPQFEYEHEWRPYDLLVWDNLTLQHGRPRASRPSEGSRVLQRVMLGRFNFSEQFEAAKQRHLANGLSLASTAIAPA